MGCGCNDDAKMKWTIEIIDPLGKIDEIIEVASPNFIGAYEIAIKYRKETGYKLHIEGIDSKGTKYDETLPIVG